MLLLFAAVAIGDAGDDREKTDLDAAIEALSASMMVDGPGWKAYDALLRPTFSRWNRRDEVMDRASLVKSLREWWDSGARVAEGNTRMVHLATQDDLAVVRFERYERFVDGDGKTFTGLITQVWRRDDSGWKLFSVDVTRTAD